MTKGAYLGLDNTANKISAIYAGDDSSIARKVVKGYIGDANGIAQQFWPNIVRGVQTTASIEHLGIKNTGGLYSNSDYSTDNYIGISYYTTSSYCKFKTPYDYTSSQSIKFRLKDLSVQLNAHEGNELKLYIELLSTEGGSRIAYNTLYFYSSSSSNNYYVTINSKSMLPNTIYYLSFRYSSEVELPNTYGNEVTITSNISEMAFTYLS